jgi:hypothetical protein
VPTSKDTLKDGLARYRQIKISVTGKKYGYRVSTRINHVANDDEECSRPVEIAQIQDRLFF